ncbi:DgyrCDS5583 [Dimorphilus gyrociliatus]|uniref:DgyrCDS5583 n=1 Tax=Dimorphilus gyrociliatus TaxID=2664684 RepID=A0A7I8VKZ5_9ANNE|nr:DgyrCDS5583 [Dimorphilus gyrociliatus]
MASIEVQMQPNSTDDHGELDFEEEVEERDDVKMEAKNEEDNIDLSEEEKAKEDGEASELSDEGELPDSNSDGELNSDNDHETGAIDIMNNRQMPNSSRPICRFFLRGACTWGNTCRYLHSDRFGGNDAWSDWRFSGQNVPPVVEAPKTESAWERGMKQAKEMVKNASARKKQEPDFNEKKLTMKVEEALPVYDDHYYDQSSEFNRIRYRSPPTPEPYAAATGQFEPAPPSAKTSRRGDEWHDPWARGRSPKRRNRHASYSSFSSSSSSSASSSRSTSSSSDSSSSTGKQHGKKPNSSKPKRQREAPRANRVSQTNPRSRQENKSGRPKESEEKRTVSIAKAPSNYQKETVKRSPPVQKVRRKKSTSSSSSSASESTGESSPDRRNKMGKQNKSKPPVNDPKMQMKGPPPKANVPKPSIKMTLTSTKNVDRMNAVKRRSAIAARLNDDSDSEVEPPAKKSAVSTTNKPREENMEIVEKPLSVSVPRQRRDSSPTKQRIKVEKSPPPQKQLINKLPPGNDKKGSSRREELLKQLKKVEDAIKRKKSKMH